MLQFWRLDVQNQGASEGCERRVGPFQASLLGLQVAIFSLVSSYYFPSTCLSLSKFPFVINSLVVMDQSPLQTSHFYWITFIKNYLQVRSHSEKLGARALTYEFWRDRSQSMTRRLYLEWLKIQSQLFTLEEEILEHRDEEIW